DGAGRLRRAEGQPAVDGALNLRDGRRERAIVEIDDVVALKFLPLPVVAADTARAVAKVVTGVSLPAVGGLLRRDVGRDEARRGERRRVLHTAAGRVGAGAGEVNVGA